MLIFFLFFATLDSEVISAMAISSVPRQTLLRLPVYLSYLKGLGSDMPSNISSATIAEALHFGPVQVRKDLACLPCTGRPKTGYITTELIRTLESFLGYDDTTNAIVVGAGKLGQALMGYSGFEAYGLHILAAFDNDPSLAGKQCAGKPVLPVDKLPGLCTRLGIHIGILTLPAEAAQSACDLLVQSGILAIWNFAPVRLQAPPGVLVQNENMASSLAVLSHHLAEKFNR